MCWSGPLTSFPAEAKIIHRFIRCKLERAGKGEIMRACGAPPFKGAGSEEIEASLFISGQPGEERVQPASIVQLGKSSWCLRRNRHIHEECNWDMNEICDGDPVDCSLQTFGG
jgi:hypothetical protein